MISNFKFPPAPRLWRAGQISNLKENRGVTVIELVVVLAVFMLIISVTVSIFILIVQQQRKILTEQAFLNQASYAIEYMSRSLRDGIKDAPGNCLGASFAGYYYLLTHFDSVDGFYQGVKFITKDNICQEFFLDTNSVLKEIKNGQSAQNILSGKFKIKYVRFIINGDKNLTGASENDSVQPRVTISLDIQFQTNSNQQERIIQTTISQNILNVQ